MRMTASGFCNELHSDERFMILLLALLRLLIIGSVPAWEYSRDWGYYPSGKIGLILIILIIMLVLGRF